MANFFKNVLIISYDTSQHLLSVPVDYVVFVLAVDVIGRYFSLPVLQWEALKMVFENGFILKISISRNSSRQIFYLCARYLIPISSSHYQNCQRVCYYGVLIFLAVLLSMRCYVRCLDWSSEEQLYRSGR